MIDKDVFDYYVIEIKPKVLTQTNMVCCTCQPLEDGVIDSTRFVSTTKTRDEWQRINIKLTRNHNGISQMENKLCLN